MEPVRLNIEYDFHAIGVRLISEFMTWSLYHKFFVVIFVIPAIQN